MQSDVFILFFFARPTDPPSREEGRWETKHFMILWGWPKGERVNGVCATNSFRAAFCRACWRGCLENKDP